MLLVAHPLRALSGKGVRQAPTSGARRVSTMSSSLIERWTT
ncbi:hypothetical protein APY03_4613 [Variovorax sp. WDL1]|nr:hypothetical protein APY03_4613 [Variovorax sp. WDL1]